ncbi:MAG: phosphatase PAP2 family protein [Flavisolibacter sp.]
MLEQLKNLDKKLFLIINNHHNSYLDPIMYWASDKLFWIPFYLLIAILLIRDNKRNALLIFLCIAVLITLTDQVSSNLIRDWAQRPRPSHEPSLTGLIHLSNAGAGGHYGFVSSHAANAFALFTFLSLILSKKFRWLKYVLFFWALLIGYSRIYNGVHYPGDVLGGALLGALFGWLISQIYFLAFKKLKWFSSM